MQNHSLSSGTHRHSNAFYFHRVDSSGSSESLSSGAAYDDIDAQSAISPVNGFTVPPSPSTSRLKVTFFNYNKNLRFEPIARLPSLENSASEATMSIDIEQSVTKEDGKEAAVMQDDINNSSVCSEDSNDAFPVVHLLGEKNSDEDTELGLESYED
jgi:hypothetical protein